MGALKAPIRGVVGDEVVRELEAIAIKLVNLGEVIYVRFLDRDALRRSDFLHLHADYHRLDAQGTDSPGGRAWVAVDRSSRSGWSGTPSSCSLDAS